MTKRNQLTVLPLIVYTPVTLLICCLWLTLQLWRAYDKSRQFTTASAAWLRRRGASTK
jgi:hypothetical protein